jgi:hypothetical protein
VRFKLRPKQREGIDLEEKVQAEGMMGRRAHGRNRLGGVEEAESRVARVLEQEGD